MIKVGLPWLQPRTRNPRGLTKYTETCSNKISQSTHYAAEIENRATIGKKVLKQYKNLMKVKFHVYLPHSKSSAKRVEIINRIKGLGGDVTYSVNKGINFLVVSDQVFKYTNSTLLKEGAIFTEIGHDQKPGKSNPEKSFSKIKEVFNDRSLRLLSSSSGFAHNPNKFCKALVPQKDKPNSEFRNLYEFFNCKRWNLISMSDLNYKLDMFESDFLKWHVRKGFKTLPGREKGNLLVTSLTNKNHKDLGLCSHTFQFNLKINSVDVSKINLEAPDGTSIFQTSYENEMAEQNFSKLMNKHQGNVHRLKQIPSCLSEIEEQHPIAGTINCTIWGMKVYRYIEHVTSPHHIKWMKKYDKDYSKIDKLCEDLAVEFETVFPRPKSLSSKHKSTYSSKIAEKKSVIKRKIKEQVKKDQLMYEYVHDRLVVMQIETQSQPQNRANVQNSWMLTQYPKNSCDSKKFYSPNSDSFDFGSSCVRPYPYIKNRVRRHVSKRPKKVYEYDDEHSKSKARRVKRNKRLRQTYFATTFHNNLSFDFGKGKGNKRRMVDTTLDMYFPFKENDEEMMEAQD